MPIRRYRDTDAAATLAVFRRAVTVTAAADYAPDQIRAWAAADETEWGRRRAATHTLVAEVDGRVAGFTDVDDHGLVDMMFVDPGHARSGVATALLAAVVAHATATGLPELTTHASRTARPFFERHGFTVTERRHPVVRGVRLENFAMRRAIDPAG
ncbi:putative acetyltransferase [Stackebrandtia albiflava]|uniref:Putative acetyltransferase n=1 Tax=Stackebrandtia albiflava TaxID=406432 RepID=A0A562V2P0_9ACTN|nr:GNAT family N-acetyltransferase [Stackebrandtia albiflava]TWJ12159.1 putative acetyltransferase [Stackebrandtia albiflava]